MQHENWPDCEGPALGIIGAVTLCGLRPSDSYARLIVASVTFDGWLGAEAIAGFWFMAGPGHKNKYMQTGNIYHTDKYSASFHILNIIILS